jgi:hypothetical protein
MNSSLICADRTTHLKTVVISLIAAIIVTVVGVNSHVSTSRNMLGSPAATLSR